MAFAKSQGTQPRENENSVHIGEHSPKRTHKKIQKRRIVMKQREKMRYEEPMVEICIVNVADMITTSNGFAGEPELL